MHMPAQVEEGLARNIPHLARPIGLRNFRTLFKCSLTRHADLPELSIGWPLVFLQEYLVNAVNKLGGKAAARGASPPKAKSHQLDPTAR
jgi:hypothetical protein